MSYSRERPNAQNRINFCFNAQDLETMMKRDAPQSNTRSFILGLLASASVITSLMLIF